MKLGMRARDIIPGAIVCHNSHNRYYDIILWTDRNFVRVFRIYKDNERLRKHTVILDKVKYYISHRIVVA